MTRSISKKGFSWDDMLTRRAGHTLGADVQPAVPAPPSTPPGAEGGEDAARALLTVDTPNALPIGAESARSPSLDAATGVEAPPPAGTPDIGPATDSSAVAQLTAASRSVAPSATFGEARATRADKERAEPAVSAGEELRYGDLRIAIGPRSLHVDSANDSLDAHHPEDGSAKLTSLQKYVILTSAGRPLVVLLIPQVVDTDDGLTNEQRAAAALIEAETDETNAASGEQTALDGDRAGAADAMIAESEEASSLPDESAKKEQLRMATTPPTSKLLT